MAKNVTLRAKLDALKNQKASKNKPAKVEIRKRAAKPLTPDELAQRAVLAKPKKEKGLDLSTLRNATGSTAPIHLFRAIRALGDEHIPTIISLLQSESRIREFSPDYKLMQPVYLTIDGTGAYVNDYVLAHVIDADETSLKCINAKGTTIASFPHGSTSIQTVEEFDAAKGDLKPASEKPVRANKTPLIGTTDFEAPTINDALDAGRIPKKRMANSDLYTLFASFSDGSSLAQGTIAEGEKPKKKKKVKAEVIADDISVDLEGTAVAPWDDEPVVAVKVNTPKKSKKLKTKNKANKKVGAPSERERIAATKAAGIDAARAKLLMDLDLSGYECDPDTAEPEVVTKQRESNVVQKFSKPSRAKVFMPLAPNVTKVKALRRDDIDEAELESVSPKLRDRLSKTIKKSKTALNKADRAKAKAAKLAKSAAKKPVVKDEYIKVKSKTKQKDAKEAVEITMEESLSALSIFKSAKH